MLGIYGTSSSVIFIQLHIIALFPSKINPLFKIFYSPAFRPLLHPCNGKLLFTVFKHLTLLP